MKKEDVTPGTIYPLLQKIFWFLPEHLKKKLSCVTPLEQTVSHISEGRTCSANLFFLLVMSKQEKES